MQNRNHIARTFGAIVAEAGKVIMDYRGRGQQPQLKQDGSPVTKADWAADAVIRSRLAVAFPDVMVITEETYSGIGLVNLPPHFILVDPLDGTREFIAGRDEFTVNIGLIESGAPVAGAIYAPVQSKLYLAGTNAFGTDLNVGEALPSIDSMRTLKAHAVPKTAPRATVSRSHLDPATKRWLEDNGVEQLHSAGSSLKFCAIAEGTADVYPRLAPTMEWDTAAGQAILQAAGGCVLSGDGYPLRYGKVGSCFRNGPFIAWGNRSEVPKHT